MENSRKGGKARAAGVRWMKESVVNEEEAKVVGARHGGPYKAVRDLEFIPKCNKRH